MSKNWTNGVGVNKGANNGSTIFTKTALSCSVIRLGAVFFVLPNIAPISTLVEFS